MILANDQKKYAFPRIKQVRLHAFSLYSLQPNINVEFAGGVLCLAGANGIGKSTFLATVNYGLTGAVPHPRRRLLSGQSYFKEASDYAGEFFTGRISESDRDEAAVTIEFEIAQSCFRITRGLFDPNDVRAFDINGVSQGGDIGAVITPLQRADVFRSKVVDAIGLTSFEQFVFLQHFVFTFDEARHLLFWDEAATAQALFLCFGAAPESAARADMLNREAEKAGSRGRNAQFQVNNIRKRMDVLRQSLGSSTVAPDKIEDLDEKYQALEAAVAQTTERADRIEHQLAEAELRVARHSAATASLRAAYAETFNRFMHGSSKPRAHPLVARALHEGVCGVCETSGTAVTDAVRSRIDQNVCPLCTMPVSGSQGPDTGIQKELAAVDERLVVARSALDESTSAQKRLRVEADQAKAKAAEVREALSKFENDHKEATDYLRGQQAAKAGPIATTLAALEHAMSEFTAARDLEYAERDKLRVELRTLQRELELRYAHAEELFVPKFRNLAGLFLGLDLDVALQMTMPVGMKLLVELRGNARHDENQMSESQRFFVDIALRMALAQQMSVEDSFATLFIDTPEGSLDIAYEDRAGDMFARFAKSGHDMLMTANINSSKLLTTLASRCGTKYMSLNPMTGWTELSEVQQGATQLFQEAYKDIASALEQGPTQ